MDPRFINYYNEELAFIREMGNEFAQEFPKAAARLALPATNECPDPYVERLLEGFAFLAARVQLRIDSEFPRFTQQLLNMVYPDYLCPVPSAAIVQITPDLSDAGLAKGVELPRDSQLSAQRSANALTFCRYHTSHSVVLWPLQIVEATYRAYAGDFPAGVQLPRAPQAVLRIRLRATAGVKLNQIACTALPVFLCAEDNAALRLYESLLGTALGMFLMAPGARRMLGRWQSKECIQEVGFSDSEALLPPGPRTFQGHRLLQEYFMFPARFLFVQLAGLGEGLRAADGNEAEIVIPLARHDPVLEGSVSADALALYCTPAVNLFVKTIDRVQVTGRHEHHVVPDRTKPMDFEVYRVTRVTGYGEGFESQREFSPFYALYDDEKEREGSAYFTLRREPRKLSEKQRRVGTRSNSYIGSELFLSFVDANEAPYPESVREVGIRTLCTNRDLPLWIPSVEGRVEFALEESLPVESVKCRRGPTAPLPAHLPDESSWRLIGLLSQNYLSLLDNNPRQGAEALRELLGLFPARGEAQIRRQIDAQVRKQLDALRAVGCRQIVRRLPTRGPVTFGRGIEATLEINEDGLGGAGAFLMGAVLRHYLARHASINGFVETALKVTGRGEVMRWPAMIGARPVI